MTSFFISIASDAVKNDFNYCLLAASLPPFLYLLAKNKRQGWLKRLFTKWAIKRTRKQVNKKRKKVKGTDILLFLLIVLGVGALMVWLLGWTWAIIITLLFFLILGSKRNNQNSDYD